VGVLESALTVEPCPTIKRAGFGVEEEIMRGKMAGVADNSTRFFERSLATPGSAPVFDGTISLKTSGFSDAD